MKNLKKLKLTIDDFLFKIASNRKENYVLWSIERSEKFKEVKQEIKNAFLKQTMEFLGNNDLWESIRNRIGKMEQIWTERDEEQIKEEVENNLSSLNSYISRELLLDFYIYLYNRGGQSYFNKRFQKAEISTVFNLKDPIIIEMLGKDIDLLITSVDNTTKKWLASQIIMGKKNKLTDMEIANEIRKKIPETYESRADNIVKTEMSEIVNKAEFETATRNGSTRKTWRAAGMNICPICQSNDGITLGMNGTFPSGDMRPPVHPRCRCLLEYDYPEFINNPWLGD